MLEKPTTRQGIKVRWVLSEWSTGCEDQLGEAHIKLPQISFPS
jgi:hypothetical protein